MEDKVEKLKFVKLPIDKENGQEMKEFEGMIGYTYLGYYSEFGKGYVITSATTEEACDAYQNSIYKSLISIGESEESAYGVAYLGEDSGMCLYFDKECFEKVEG